MAKILYVANFDGFFISHRLPLAIEARKRGHEVIILCENTGKADIIIEEGFQYIELPVKREKKINILEEVKYLFFLYRNYKKIGPDIIHHISIKPVFYGSLVTKFLRHKISVVNAFSGMGYLFTASRKRFSEFFLIPLFRFIFKQENLKIILQNKDDYDFFIKKKIVNSSKLEIIKGSGVDLNVFSFRSVPPVREGLKILFPARMLRDKGVMEFYQAASEIKKDYPLVQFVLCGDIDKANPSSLTMEQLEQWNEEGIVSWVGFQKDMAEVLERHHVVVLPSYREGLPKSLIEACAIGRPIITTDTNGCRECVVQNFNGMLIPVKDSLKLAEAIRTLIRTPMLLSKFGANSRQLAEKEFDINDVLIKTMMIYQGLLDLA